MNLDKKTVLHLTSTYLLSLLNASLKTLGDDRYMTFWKVSVMAASAAISSSFIDSSITSVS